MHDSPGSAGRPEPPCGTIALSRAPPPPIFMPTPGCDVSRTAPDLWLGLFVSTRSTLAFWLALLDIPTTVSGPIEASGGVVDPHGGLQVAIPSYRMVQPAGKPQPPCLPLSPQASISKHVCRCACPCGSDTTGCNGTGHQTGICLLVIHLVPTVGPHLKGVDLTAPSKPPPPHLTSIRQPPPILR